MECLKCGDTGIKLDGKPCDCGAAVHVEKKSPIEIYVPEIYRGSSEIIGLREIVAGELNKNRTFQIFLSEFVDSLLSDLGHPSLFIDMSATPLGAYEVYYAIIEKIVAKKDGLNDRIKEQIKVNELNVELLSDCNQKIKEGRPLNECYAYIISDFEIGKYPLLSDYMKIINPRDAKFPWKYPLNMYHLKIKSIVGGM